MGVCGQGLHLFVILIKLKAWRFLGMLPVFAALASNLYLYDITKSWTVQMGATDLQIVGPKDFQNVAVVVADTTKDALELAVLADAATRMSGVNFNVNNLETCNVNTNCHDIFFQLLVGKRKGKIAHYVNYRASKDQAKLQCQLATGTELYCPYLAHLIGVSQSLESKTIFQFQSATTFKLSSSWNVIKRSGTIAQSASICEKDHNFPSVLPRTLLAQMIFVAIVLTFYLLISTVSCIHALKHNGFLQLMFRRGLSVLVYWIVLLIITLLEMAIFAAVLTVAHNFQCEGFYPTARLISVFFCSFIQFSCMATFVLLFAVVTTKMEITSLLACVLSFLSIIGIVLNRTILSEPNSSSMGKYIILLVPFGHIAEQVYAALLQGDIKSIDNFYKLVLPVSAALFGVALLVTIYLDFVLKSGSGRRFPLLFIFNSNLYGLKNQSYEVLPEPQPSVMLEDVSISAKPTVRTFGLNKSFKGCFATPTVRLQDFSGRFNQDQITAIVGHNGSGKSILLQILSGERLPTSGKATVNNLLITNPVCRFHIGREIGYCPQVDSLVGSLTIRDTLKLAIYSTGLIWEDIQMEVKAILSALQIDDKLDQSNHSLSSSDKRKVCIAIALVGRPYIVLLDNPMRDMDFISKRRLWKLLHDFKSNHVVIVSTLFMEEVDGMADKMVFLSGGRTLCAGSSFFFKRAFDCRFIIQIASKTEFHVPYLIRKITSKFTSVRVRSFSEADLELELPLSEDYILPEVALEIESMSEIIDEFGIANYSLDDVFSKLKPMKNSEVEDHFKSGTIGYVADDVDRMKDIQSRSAKLSFAPSLAVEKSGASVIGTITSMLVAHFIQLRRSRVRLVIRVALPLLLLVVLIVGGVLEKRLKNDEIAVRQSLSVTNKYERERGVCLYYYLTGASLPTDVHTDAINELDCSLMLNGMINGTSTAHNVEYDTIKRHMLNIREYEVGNFMQAILSNQTNVAIRKACRKAVMPCPVIFSPTFCPDALTIKNYSMYVGTYVPDVANLPMKVAMATIELYRNTYIRTVERNLESTLNITKHHSSRDHPVKPQIDAEGIMDIRTIFFWLYSLFIQLILLALMPSACLSDVIQDKDRGIVGQLMSIGLTRVYYWICIFFNHWLQLALIYILSTILLIILIPVYSNMLYIVAALMPTLTLGLTNGLLCVYCISSVVESNIEVWIAIYTCYSLVTTLCTIIAPSNDLVVLFITFLFPQCAIAAPTYFSSRLIHYSMAYYSAEKEGIPNLLSSLIHLGSIRDALIALVVHFILLLGLLIILENREKVYPRCMKKMHGSATQDYENCKEAPIADGARKIYSNPKRDEYIMEVSHLQAADAHSNLALKDLTIGLKCGEAIALLGPCGSGKGSAIRAIVGEKRPVAGRVEFHVHDRWLCGETASQHGFIGYCPKYDPLIGTLTVRENLCFYTRAAGVSQEHMLLLVRKFHLEAELNVLAMRTTAGVRRRLTLAIAVLQSPKFIAIDGASAGVDPQGRKLLWQAIRSLATKESGIIVATQEMDEAEKLCDRICIMNGGQMVAINTIHEIILRYKKMYFIEIQLQEGANDTIESAELRKAELIDVIQEKFPGALVIQQQTWRVQFGIPIKSICRLSSSLSWLLEKKSKLNMLYFTIHYATVDQTMKAIVVHREEQLYRQRSEAAMKVTPVDA